MPTEVLKNNIQTTLLAAIDSNDLTITPTDPTGWPATGEQARAVIGDEILLVTGGDGPQFDVERGAEGTTAVGHAAGEAVRLVLTAAGFSALAREASGLKVVTRRLTTAELETLGDAPVELVPAVSGAMLVGVSGVWQSVGGTPFAGSAASVAFAAGIGTADIGAVMPMTSTPVVEPFVFDLNGGLVADCLGPIVVSADSNPSSAVGPITSTVRGVGGALYQVGDTATLAGGNNDAVVEITGVDGAGAITSYTVTNPGTGYGTGYPAPCDLVALTGIGEGGTVAVIGVDPSDAPSVEVDVTVAYYVVPAA